MTREDGVVRIVVADDGPGIPEEDQERLSRPYARGSEASANGTRLGLFISRAIVEAHGGRIGVESRPGAGARDAIPRVSRCCINKTWCG